jgi:biopolymer transport protein ExbB/TolQ
MATYTVQRKFTQWETVKVEADSFEDAIELANDSDYWSAIEETYDYTDDYWVRNDETLEDRTDF